MSARASVIAIGAVSPLGVGEAAFDVCELGAEAPVAIRRDPAFVERGFARPNSGRAPDNAFDGTEPGDRACRLLDKATDLALDALFKARPGVAAERVALVLGTSSGGMCTSERLFEQRSRGEPVSRELAEGATYFAPFVRARDRLGARGLSITKSLHVVTACAASTWAMGVGFRWLESEAADVVLAGGYDALCTFVAAGFESLRATSASRPAPFRIGRDGMSVGEGAGLVALVREGNERGATIRFHVSGFGGSTDAVHVTAPDRTGGGIARAARAALRDASVDARACTLVSAHATSTPFNDAMESRAIRSVFDGADPIVHPFKAQIGHTLGAAGVLETLALARAVEKGVAPAAAGTGEMDPDAPARLLDRAEALASNAGLKLSAAFGGANAALVVEKAGHPSGRVSRPRRPVYLARIATADEADTNAVALESGEPADKLARMDALSALLATAIAKLGKSSIVGAGILTNHGLATIDINERFYARILAKGPTAAEPRLFPPTSPNVMPGQVAIPFGLTGPSAALASGPGGALDPLILAIEMVAAGDADKMVVSAVDVVGPCAESVLETAFPEERDVVTGAVAALVTSDPADAIATLSPGPVTPITPAGFGQRALRQFLAKLAGKAATLA